VSTIAPLAFLVPILSAGLVALAAPLKSRALTIVMAVAATVAAVVLCALLYSRTRDGTVVEWLGGWKPRGGVAFGIDLAADRLGAGLAVFTAVLAIFAALLSSRLIVASPEHFHAVALLFVAAMIAFCLTGDLFNLFVFFELMSVAAYVLVGYEIHQRRALEGALTFAITNTAGSILMLFGIGLVYGETGALNLAQIGRVLGETGANATVAVAFGLIAAGLLVKAALVPFHFWVADAYAVAPTPVCIMLAGVFSELGLYGLARVWWTAFEPALGGGTDSLRIILVVAGVLTGVVGGALALAQHHLKRMLAYVAIAQVGVMTVGIGLLSADGLAGTAIFLVGDGLVKAALFVCVAVLQHRYDRVDVHALHGRARELPLTGAVYALAALAIAGLPPFGSFAGRALIEDAALKEHGYRWVPALLALICALSAAALLRAGVRVFLGWGRRAPRDPLEEAPEEEQTEDESGEADEGPRTASPWLWGPGVVLVVLAILWGLVPDLAHTATVAAAHFVSPEGYAAAVLGGREPPLEIPHVHPPGHTAYLYAAASVGASLVVAYAGLREFGLPQPLAGAVDRIRALHSGHPGDYVAWAAAGATVFTALFALTLT
jgi:multicomponent Na+:H+ antiporter subunit D